MSDRVEGTILDERGQPVAAIVKLVQIRDEDASGVTAYKPFTTSVATNPDGTFFALLDGGDYSVLIGDAEKWALDVRVPGDGGTHSIGDIRIDTKQVVEYFEQLVAQSTVTWTHNKGRKMMFQVTDLNGTAIVHDSQDVDLNTIQVRFPYDRTCRILAI